MVVDLASSLVARQAGEETPVLHLFGGPFVTYGRRRVSVPEGSKRLLVFVALHRGQVERGYAAGTLWPAGTEYRAAGNLRSALWRLSRAELPLLRADKCYLTLQQEVVVDARLVSEWASRLISGRPQQDDLVALPTGADALDLLPGWYEDWALIERERLRQRMLHALEALSRELVEIGRCAEAVEAAMMAVGAEPLRESAQRALIQAHLAEGNWSEGYRQLSLYRKTLQRELGLEPDPQLAAMLELPEAGSPGGARRVVAAMGNPGRER
jgi:DNA-binding SARP family transcriptional activator